MGQIFHENNEIWVIGQLYGTNLLRDQRDLGYRIALWDKS